MPHFSLIRWEQLWRRAGAQEIPRAMFQRLSELYSEPHRAYHNIDHIEYCLAEFENAKRECARPDEVELAIWFHDAIYDPRAKDNEELSAKLFVDCAGIAGLQQNVISNVLDLILATKHVKPPESPDARLLVDIDLSILGQTQAIFDAYEVAIRKEYEWVLEDQFRTGRAAILELFLARPRIFQTPYLFDRYELSARANLDRSIAKLSH